MINASRPRQRRLDQRPPPVVNDRLAHLPDSALRPGDVASCYVDPAAAAKLPGWQAKFGIERMCADHGRWQAQNPQGFKAA
jgi:UDP-glucose 4-epimerase